MGCSSDSGISYIHCDILHVKQFRSEHIFFSCSMAIVNFNTFHMVIVSYFNLGNLTYQSPLNSASPISWLKI
jgi:hypothetical protein